MRRGRPPHPDVLTPREWQVLELMRAGLTNKEIAGRLGITERGAKYHVSEILSKLGMDRREDARTWRREKLHRVGLAALLARPSGTVTRIASGLLASGVVALLALGLGVAVMERRGGQAETLASDQKTEERAREEMIQLADEATAAARSVEPESVLFSLAHQSSNYYYRFSLGDQGRVLVTGPNSEPGKPRWEVMAVSFGTRSIVPPPLDVRTLQKTPVALRQAMPSALGRVPPRPGTVEVSTRDGEVAWDIYAGPVYCGLKDASPLSTMTCIDSERLPSAQELEEMRRAADVAPAGGASAPDSGQQWGCPFEARVITLDVDKAEMAQGRSGGSITEWFGDCPVFLEARPGGSQIADANAPCQLVLITKPGSFVSGWEGRQFGKCDGVAIFHSTGFPPRAAEP
jgi:DNA-binding CsgD family transcriptional regulator